jgi:hypothetical protein
MPILTKAVTPVKGSSTLFTLDKAALAAVTSVAADAYYSNSARWKSVNLIYKSSTGSQREVVKFDATLSSPTSKFLVSARAKDIFQIQKIVIKDFDGGTFEVLSSELTTTEFDVDMGEILTTTNPTDLRIHYFYGEVYLAWDTYNINDVSFKIEESANGGAYVVKQNVETINFSFLVGANGLKQSPSTRSPGTTLKYRLTVEKSGVTSATPLETSTFTVPSGTLLYTRNLVGATQDNSLETLEVLYPFGGGVGSGTVELTGDGVHMTGELADLRYTNNLNGIITESGGYYIESNYIVTAPIENLEVIFSTTVSSYSSAFRTVGTRSLRTYRTLATFLGQGVTNTSYTFKCIGVASQDVTLTTFNVYKTVDQVIY